MHHLQGRPPSDKRGTCDSRQQAHRWRLRGGLAPATSAHFRDARFHHLGPIHLHRRADVAGLPKATMKLSQDDTQAPAHGARRTSSGWGREPRFFTEKSLHAQASLKPWSPGGGHARGRLLTDPAKGQRPQKLLRKAGMLKRKVRRTATPGGPVAPGGSAPPARRGGSRGPNTQHPSGSGCALSVPDGRHGFTFQPRAQRPVRCSASAPAAAAAAGTTATAPAEALSDRGASSHTPAPAPARRARALIGRARRGRPAPPRARGRSGARRPGRPEPPARPEPARPRSVGTRAPWPS